jgi:hypothetical protein
MIVKPFLKKRGATKAEQLSVDVGVQRRKGIEPSEFQVADDTLVEWTRRPSQPAPARGQLHSDLAARLIWCREQGPCSCCCARRLFVTPLIPSDARVLFRQ